MKKFMLRIKGLPRAARNVVVSHVNDWLGLGRLREDILALSLEVQHLRETESKVASLEEVQAMFDSLTEKVDELESGLGDKMDVDEIDTSDLITGSDLCEGVRDAIAVDRDVADAIFELIATKLRG